MRHLIRRAVAGALEADPLLAKIGVRRTEHVGPIRNVRSPRLDQPLEEFETSAAIAKTAVLACDVDAHTCFVHELATQHVEQVSKMLFRSLDKVTQATGQMVSAGGARISWDLLLDALEKMEVGVTADGKLSKVTFVGHPDQLAKLPPPTEAQLQRLNDIQKRKIEAHAASKRTRRLPR